MARPIATPSGIYEWFPSEQLGQAGRDGAVYRGAVRASGEAVAIKVLSAKHCVSKWSETSREGQFLAAVAAARASGSPPAGLEHLVLPRAVEQASGLRGRVCIIMDLLPEGDMLKRTVSVAKPGFIAFGEDETARMIAQLVLAVDAMHKLGFAHRDIKLDNIMSASPGCQLADFGLVQSCKHMTRQHRLPRRPPAQHVDFYGPEMYTSYCWDARRFDSWGIGACAASLLTGSGVTITRRSIVKMPCDIERFSQSCRSFLSKCLQVDPKFRETADTLLEHPWLAPHLAKPASLEAEASAESSSLLHLPDAGAVTPGVTPAASSVITTPTPTPTPAAASPAFGSGTFGCGSIGSSGDGFGFGWAGTPTAGEEGAHAPDTTHRPVAPQEEASTPAQDGEEDVRTRIAATPISLTGAETPQGRAQGNRTGAEAAMSAEAMAKAAEDVRKAMDGLSGLCQVQDHDNESGAIGTSISDESPWAPAPLRRARTFHAHQESWEVDEEANEQGSRRAMHKGYSSFVAPSKPQPAQGDSALAADSQTPGHPATGNATPSARSTASKVSSRLTRSGCGKVRTTSHRSLRRWRSASELFETSTTPPPLPIKEPDELRPESDASSCSETLSNSGGTVERLLAIAASGAADSSAASSTSTTAAAPAAAIIPPTMPVEALRTAAVQ